MRAVNPDEPVEVIEVEMSGGDFKSIEVKVSDKSVNALEAEIKSYRKYVDGYGSDDPARKTGEGDIRRLAAAMRIARDGLGASL